MAMVSVVCGFSLRPARLLTFSKKSASDFSCFSSELLCAWALTGAHSNSYNFFSPASFHFKVAIFHWFLTTELLNESSYHVHLILISYLLTLIIFIRTKSISLLSPLLALSLWVPCEFQ